MAAVISASEATLAAFVQNFICQLQVVLVADGARVENDCT
jgi:hypothetical protein